MRTNLIQSYLQNNARAVQQYHADNAKKNFDVNKELSNRTFIKPLPSNGHLVNISLFDLPSECFKDIKYSTKAFLHAAKGTANDNELGHLNDLGMKLGGIAIATYLLSRKSAPLAKTMEFVGLVSFFAAMDLWPKLALQWPAKLIHGFDIRQQYRDNYGTKKPVFQDHQFIPWDLYSDEEINKIGDRLGVPKEMKNRRDFIQEKMRKIALQNNTMWMLTAGFATPIMSALICEALKTPIHKYQDDKINKKANELLSNFNTEIGKYDFSGKNKALDTLLEGNKGKTITPELFEKIAKQISQGMDAITANALKRDLKNVIMQKGHNITRESFENLGTFLQEQFKNISPNDAKQIIPTAEEIIAKLDDRHKGIINSGESIIGETEFSSYVKALADAFDEKITSFEQTYPDKNSAGIRFLTDEILQSEALSKQFKSLPSSVLTESTINELKEINKSLNTFQARQRVLNKYAYLKSAQAQETYLANTWNGILDDDLLKTLDINSADIKKTRMDSNLANQLLRDKIESIVSDDTKYNKVIDKIIEKLNYLESRTEFAQYNKYDSNEKNPYKTYVDTTFDDASNELKAHKMRYTAQRLTGYDVNRQAGEIDTHTLKDLQLSFIQDRVRGVKNSFYRLLNTLDFFKRVSDNQNLDSLKEYNFNSNGRLIKHVDFSRPVKEEMVEMVKQLLMRGRSSDYAVKFFFLRDPELNPDNLTDEQRKLRFSDIKTEMGKVLNEFYGKKDAAQLVDNPHDRIFYDSAMRLMYGDRLSPKTKSKIENSMFFKNFEQYRQELLSYLGGDEYFIKKNHKVDGGKASSTEFRFNLLGSAVDDMFTKLFKQKFNSRTWLNIFGGLGIGLFCITVLSQFFMGRMPNDRIIKENQQ